jgi:hypothetical protein
MEKPKLTADELKKEPIEKADLDVEDLEDVAGGVRGADMDEDCCGCDCWVD